MAESGTTTTSSSSSSSSSSSRPSAWMETNKKRKNEQPPKQSLLVGADNPAPAPAPDLPLDWTRVKRRRPGSNDNEDCCPPAVEILKEDSLDETSQELVRGLGVICLHDSDPSWFQGYFFPNLQRRRRPVTNTTTTTTTTGSGRGSHSRNDDDDGDRSPPPVVGAELHKPWGLLAVQEPLDDCMRCADGGYRRVTLSVFRYHPEQRRKKESIGNIEWTGGDMMRLCGEKASLEPEQLLTGPQAVPQVEKLFHDLLDKCRKNLDPNEPSSVLDLLPDVAVIVGPMKLVLTKNKNDDDDDLW